jgi:hypothetical protein
MELMIAFTIFQYFLRVVPTTYIDAGRRKLVTSQVSLESMEVLMAVCGHGLFTVVRAWPRGARDLSQVRARGYGPHDT